VLDLDVPARQLSQEDRLVSPIRLRMADAEDNRPLRVEQHGRSGMQIGQLNALSQKRIVRLPVHADHVDSRLRPGHVDLRFGEECGRTRRAFCQFLDRGFQLLLHRRGFRSRCALVDLFQELLHQRFDRFRLEGIVHDQVHEHLGPQRSRLVFVEKLQHGLGQTARCYSFQTHQNAPRSKNDVSEGWLANL